MEIDPFPLTEALGASWAAGLRGRETKMKKKKVLEEKMEKTRWSKDHRQDLKRGFVQWLATTNYVHAATIHSIWNKRNGKTRRFLWSSGSPPFFHLRMVIAKEYVRKPWKLCITNLTDSLKLPAMQKWKFLKEPSSSKLPVLISSSQG